MKMHPHTYEAYQLFHEGTLAFAKAERQGIRFDYQKAIESQKEIDQRIKKLEQKIYDSKFFKRWQKISRTPVNIYSGKQLGEYLYKHLGVEVSVTTKTGMGATSEEALKNLKIKEIQYLLKIRKLKKIRDTYLEQYIRENNNGVIHSNFNLSFVRTYRSSSSNPNFQNAPKRDEEARKYIRQCLLPRKGHQFLEVDYGQLEVRISACYNQDKNLITDILHGDMHKDMAQELFMLDNLDKSKKGHSTLRKAAKNGFVFPQFYGDYYKNCALILASEWGKLPKKGRWKTRQGIEIEPEYYLSDHLIKHKIRSMDNFIDHVQRVEDRFWNERFRVYNKWKEQWYTKYQKKGYVDLKTGFRCVDLMSRNDAINYPIQGSAFHCLLWSFITIMSILEERKMDTKIVNQVHDSILLDVHPDELESVVELVVDVTTRQLREHWDWIIVPLEIDAEYGEIDQPWYNLKPYPLPLKN